MIYVTDNTYRISSLLVGGLFLGLLLLVLEGHFESLGEDACGLLRGDHAHDVPHLTQLQSLPVTLPGKHCIQHSRS